MCKTWRLTHCDGECPIAFISDVHGNGHCFIYPATMKQIFRRNVVATAFLSLLWRNKNRLLYFTYCPVCGKKLDTFDENGLVRMVQVAIDAAHEQILTEHANS